MLEDFPINSRNPVKGARRLAREKAMQTLAAALMSKEPWGAIFKHVFTRDFKFDPDEVEETGRPLKPEELEEVENDKLIEWSDEDFRYGRLVVENALKYAELTDSIIEDCAKNWKLERLAWIDRTLLWLATAEFVACDDIPVKVTINEIISLGKKYSTEKSGSFLNGMLETIATKLEETNMMKKTGKGLE